MGWHNPPLPWSELERRLSDRPARPGRAEEEPRPARPAAVPVVRRRRRASAATTAYAELHCHSNFSFLDGASHPAELVAEAARLGLSALALTDHDGLYGVVRFAEAAAAAELPTVFGAELTLDGPAKAQAGVADPAGRHLVVLARDPAGYARLSRAISVAQMASSRTGRAQGHPVTPIAPRTLEHGEKGAPQVGLEELAGLHGGRWQVLTGCRKGAVPAALVESGPTAAARELAHLVDAFGRENVAVELWDHGDPLDSARNDALAALALRAGVDVVTTNNVHYATPARRPLATALAAVRAQRSLDEIDGWLPASASAHLRSGAEQARRFARYPGVVERAAELGRACAFDLRLVAPNLPDYPVPPGHTEMSWLRELTRRGAERRYGPADHNPRAYAQIEHELDVIESLGFPGYFLIVWDIVDFCRRNDIYCQGRGSAANSAVCYALGITNADAVALGLLFERFLSPERDGPPDIDIDIENGRREEAIQYVYERYGRENAAQVANVITYRPKSSVRDMGKALGHPPGALDAWSKQIEGWVMREVPDDTDVPEPVLALARQVEGFPRHLGIHSGGMVICDRPVVEVCPVEWGRMEGRSVLQWDKDDCAAVGLVKIDLLGLGMLTALHLGVDLIRRHHGVEVDLATIPQEPEVYEMLCRADSVGVFQVESRAQMATLPRLKPRTFYDLVVEVALIRPGPIQGGSVHPYIRRRNGAEPVTYLHPLLEPALKKTLGVPLFQEQLMQIAIDVAGFTPGEADQLRQAMGSKRSHERMKALRGRLYEGMASNGITGEVADAIYEKLAAFADFGFPESHSVSFAYLVYASAWMKLHYPAAFCAALLNAQPMGFYSPNTLVADARRHGVSVLGPDVNRSEATALLVDPAGAPTPASSPKAGAPAPPGAVLDPARAAVRLGIGYVRNVGDDLAARIAERRPYTSMDDLVRRTGAPLPAVEALATAGAFASLGHERREALWGAGAVTQTGPERLDGVVCGVDAPTLPGMSEIEVTAADLWATGVSPDRHPVQFARARLDERGAVTVAGLDDVPHGRRVLVGGVVTHRQRPATAQGTIFLNLEDETGMLNVICSTGVWARHRRVARAAPALVIRGRLERAEGATNLVAERIEALSIEVTPSRSRDFR
ncbi:MAG TPA: error-prone DNA polymerase [Acidimicrobiales bacterium]|nr:error-prone DNA polymerase [Acidimicrobiales bacterium]